MKKFTMIAATAVTGVTLAATLAVPAYAWHPEGKIVKSVQNVTAGGALSDANTVADAVSAKPGDTLKYVIVISNPAAEDDNNTLADTVMTDTLPAGVELVNNPSQRTITENIGKIAPGKSVTKEYLVKVTANKDGVILNTACFEGDSEVHDNKKQGCDDANVTVKVPPVVTPPAPVTPPTVPAPVTPVTLPKTGPANVIVLGAVAMIAGYALNILRLKLRADQ